MSLFRKQSEPSLSRAQRANGSAKHPNRGGAPGAAVMERPQKPKVEKKAEPPVPREQNGLLVPLVQEPPDTPPQRGYLSDDWATNLRLQLQLADMLRKKVLAPELPLDIPLERTAERETKARQTLQQLFDSGRMMVPSNTTETAFTNNVLNETFGFGPLQRFIDTDDISEIMVNGPYVIFVEIKGRLLETGHKFLDDDHCERIIKRIAQPLGRLADSENPLVDARLPDGSRFNAVMRPVAIDGPSMSIRKFSKEKLTIQDLINFGSMTEDMAYFLEAIVVGRQNVVVSGGTGSGKTTLINCLSTFIPEHERSVTIEDSAELQLKQRNVVRLETKKPTPQTPREITVRDCVRNALRMRPERIIVGECRGGETLDMLQAMNTGHDGSMTTVHANDPRSCISRLETLVLMSGEELPINIVRKQIAGSVNFIVQASRLRDGSRKVTHITEIAGMEGDTVVLNNIFSFVDDGDDPEGKVTGYHAPNGLRPMCEPTLKQYGYPLPATLFMKSMKRK
ncbi:MAG: CpaF family protein [Ardenticatenaceae bacterium]|nr:CpaF family protein [Ardenticatenaceae bacterium]